MAERMLWSASRRGWPRRFCLCLALPLALAGGTCASSAAAQPPRPAADAALPRAPAGELVVLVHGMGRTSLSMLPLRWSLERSGYRVLNFHYSSYGPSVDEIGTRLADALEAELRARPATRVHLVGHSLGSILLRWLLAHHPPPVQLGRFVMLAPPNRGSHVADRLAPYLRWLLPPIEALRTGTGMAARLPPPHGVQFAVVAGGWDGKVEVAETCLTGAAAHVVVPSDHALIMARPRVHRLVRSFLATGTLPPSETGSAPACA